MAVQKSNYVLGVSNSPQPTGGEVMLVPVAITLSSATLASGDLLSMVDLPLGVWITDFSIHAPQLDSNGSPTLAFSLGTETAAGDDLAVVFESALIFGRTANGSVSRMTFGGSPVTDYATANPSTIPAINTRRISLKCTTAAATAATSGKVITLILHLRG